ncbi:MAG: DUF3365 domain-containing protein [Gammaproteobacteria bacterium]|jgi:hypothetical protein
MKTRIALPIILSSLAAQPALADTQAERVKASRAAIAEFAKSLKGELQAAMKAGGPVNAVGVCNSEATEIAKRVSAEKGIQISRTSLKYRNPNNAPTDWQKTVLEQFEQRKAAGEPVKMIDYRAEVDTPNGREFRYMKAIPTGALCLTCHGEQIAAPVKAKLEALYPHDRATGFKQGDIRGAFVVIQKM